MPAFIVSIVYINDPIGFQAYASSISGLAERFGGEYLLRGSVVEMLEGSSAQPERAVVLRFPDAAAARAYISSADYISAKVKRKGAANVSMRLIEA